MALHELTEEQTRTWTRAQKDQWWLDNVFRGDLPQLTVRSALTGFLLGGVLSATNLYIGAKTGTTLGVGLTSVILAFAFFKLLARAGMARDFTILENNAMQSIATAAGYMTSPLISSLAALMLKTGVVVPWWQLLLWNCVICVIGVLVAFPMKRRFINEEQLPFPEGRACGVVLDTLYENGEAGGETGPDSPVEGGKSAEIAVGGMFKARVLGVAAALAAIWQFLVSEGWMRLVQGKLLRLIGEKDAPWHISETLSDYYYLLAAKYDWWLPRILGTDVRKMGLEIGGDLAMVGVGGLMGVRTSAGMLAGALINFGLLGPVMLHCQPGLFSQPAAMVNRGQFVNQWGLWWPITAMVVGSMVSLFSKPRMFVGAFRAFFRPKGTAGGAREVDVLRHIELPLWVSWVGIPIFGACGAWMAHAFFGAKWELVLVSIPLAFGLTLIAANAMGLTSWTPVGALSKITQFSMGVLDRTNAATNLSTAGMTGEIAGNAANLLSDIKPGYMLGAKPRQQAVGHVIGILSGAIASTPIFYLLFLPPGPDGRRDVNTLISDQFPMPGAVQWKGVADFIEKGFGSLPPSVLVAMGVAGALAFVFEILRIRTRGRFPLSGVTLGLGAVLPPSACLCMFAGALFFFMMGRHNPVPGTRGNQLWRGCLEPICAGLITGAALTGIGDAICRVAL
ncbi:MAG: OPT/YSL family transporter [Puniceicoccales bacterium]|jgi:uncharacterized oligopeptide transporter (OPT) family protein|nr:OPT/YSL family transporter [Puniceicoccales bacterium]